MSWWPRDCKRSIEICRLPINPQSNANANVLVFAGIRRGGLGDPRRCQTHGICSAQYQLKFCLHAGTMTCLKNVKNKHEKKNIKNKTTTTTQPHTNRMTHSSPGHRSRYHFCQRKAVPCREPIGFNPKPLPAVEGWKDEIRIYRKQSTKVYSVYVEGCFVWFIFFFQHQPRCVRFHLFFL